ncbi:MAG TPA: PDZ domain-containing protein [Pyrinomonadaceae bacterium]|nr:PDZ domain-containing protein [Pyrinomonadaceae bacterium]
MDDTSEFTKTIRFPGDAQAGVLAPGKPKKARRKMSGMAWIFVGLLVFFIGAAAFTAVISPVRNHATIVQQTANKSYVGATEWQDVEGDGPGVTFDNVNPPGGPADKAGMVGGDVIVSFDGQRIQDADHMNEVMGRTPIGKTVDVEYMRDGETHKTQLTTISRDEYRRLDEAFRERPEGRGQFGYDDDAQRVQLPNSKMYGVQLDTVYQSRPADMAGIKKGDIVVEFDGVPIRTPEELVTRVHRALPYSTVKVVVIRGDQKLEIPVKMGKQ